MADVQFEEHENEYVPTRVREEPKDVDLTGMLVKKGVAKDSRSAEKILLVVAVVLFALAAFNFYTHWHRATPADQAQQLHPEDQVVHTLPGS